MRTSILAILMVFVFTGCSGLWEMVSIGKMNGKADEEGMNYEDTGVLADPYFLYSHRKSINPAAIYPNPECRKNYEENLLIDSEAKR